MKLIKGLHNRAKVYASFVDEKTKEQIKHLMDQEVFKDCKVSIMPDCHVGKGCVIGTTMTIKNKVVPNIVGVDIGCGMLTINLKDIDIDLPALDTFIHKNIPSGTCVHHHKVDCKVDITKLLCYEFLENKERLNSSCGTLGGGNHFIEIDVDKDNNKYLIIHSGSRYLGVQVCNYYQKLAISNQKQQFNEMLKNDIQMLKDENRQSEIEEYIQTKNEEFANNFEPGLAYLENEDFKNYLHDMDICQQFASENRLSIANKILEFLNLNINDLYYFETIHNYINMDDMILRKGAIAAYKNQMVLIPINMKDGAILAYGKSCKKYNYSAPHGAGRILSRSKAMEEISLDDFKKAMEGIYSTTVTKNTLDESPFAYKKIEDILENITDTAEIIDIIKPIYNFKAS